VFPTARAQRCWFHKSANVLAALPRSAHARAIKAMQEIYNAEDIDHAVVAVKAFKIDYVKKFPKAVEKITSEMDVLLEFYNYPADHWVHLRTTNPIVIWSWPRERPGDLRICVMDGVRDAGFSLV